MIDKRLILLYGLFFFHLTYAQFGDSFPVMKFDQDTVDFGVVNEGDTVRYDFWFTNVGKNYLMIKQAYPACGCTYPTFTKTAIKPGERGMIHVEFHSQGWGGQTIVKEVIVILGNGPENYARFKAKVVNMAFLKEAEEYKKSQESQLIKKKKKSKRHKQEKNVRQFNSAFCAFIHSRYA